jgi:G3E family GTPase
MYSFGPRPSLLPFTSSSHDGDGDGAHQHPHALENAISSITIPLPSLLPSKSAFESPLQNLLWEPPDGVDILRIKAFFVTPEGGWVCQGVRELFETASLGAADGSTEGIKPKLILIGRGLDKITFKIEEHDKAVNDE